MGGSFENFSSDSVNAAEKELSLAEEIELGKQRQKEKFDAIPDMPKIETAPTYKALVDANGAVLHELKPEDEEPDALARIKKMLVRMRKVSGISDLEIKEFKEKTNPDDNGAGIMFRGDNSASSN